MNAFWECVSWDQSHGLVALSMLACGYHAANLVVHSGHHVVMSVDRRMLACMKHKSYFCKHQADRKTSHTFFKLFHSHFVIHSAKTLHMSAVQGLSKTADGGHQNLKPGRKACASLCAIEKPCPSL